MDNKFGKAYVEYVFEYILDEVKKEQYIDENTKEFKFIKAVIQKEIFIRCFKSLLYSMNLERSENNLKGNTSEERYNFFCNTEYCIISMNKIFPTIKEQIKEEIYGKFMYIYRVLVDFLGNQKDICQHFWGTNVEEIIEINNGGDWHNDKCVLIISFASKKRIVFKPTHGKNLEFLSGMMNFFFEKEYTELYDSLCTCEGTWVKFVEHIEVQEQEDIESFYYNYGKMLFVSYILGINDMHYENIIAHKNYPVITDVETIFSSYLFFSTHKFQYDAQYSAVKKLLYGVMATGLVPIFSMTEYFGGDVSCLSNKGIKIMVEKIRNEYRDDMCIYIEPEIINQSNHLPNRDVEPLTYGNQIMLGFNDAERIFCINQNKIRNFILQNFEKVESRIILNMTKGYSKILRIKSDPRYRFEPRLYKQLLENLKRNNEFNEEVYTHEVRELCTSNIPSFYWNANENCVYGRHVDSLIKIMEVRDFNKEEITKIIDEQTSYKVLNEQKKLIDNSIMSSIVLGIEHQQKADNIFGNNPGKKSVIFLRENIDENCIIGNDGTINWIGLMVNDKEQLEYAILDWSLYSGIVGIGYMYLSEYIVSGDAKTLYMLERIYTTIIKALELGIFNDYNISYFCGLTGIYAFLKKLANNRIMSADIIEVQLEKFRNLIRRNINKTSCFDTLSGIHSAVIYYFSDYKEQSFSEEMIINISLYFIDKFDINIMEKEFNYASFAHGYCGVMTSVMCMNAVKHDDKYVDFIRQLWEKEDYLYKGKFKWIDKRNDRNVYSHFWCHGSCGIMQARLIWKKYGFLQGGLISVTEEQLTKELLEYKKYIETKKYNSLNNSLCHGNFAYIDFLISYDKVFGESIDVDYCDKTFCAAREQGYSCIGAPGAINAIGFMVGESGIQYLLNRFAKRELCSVLVMENL